MKYRQVHGVIVATITPFNEDGRVEAGMLRDLNEFLVAKGIQGIFSCGSTGEGILLSTEERETAAKLTVQQVQGRVPVIIHTGSIHVNEAIRLTVHAREIGADGAALIPPYYYNMDDDCILEYYRTIAGAVADFPIYLYNIPMNAKNAIRPVVLAKLMKELPNIAGVKESSMDFMNFIHYQEAVPENLCALMGNDAQIYTGLLMGGAGAISATAAAFPEEVAAIYQHYQSGDLEKALAAQRVVIKLREIFRRFTPVAPYKQVLEWQGIKAGLPRRPLRPLSEPEKELLAEELAAVGFNFK